MQQLPNMYWGSALRRSPSSAVPGIILTSIVRGMRNWQCINNKVCIYGEQHLSVYRNACSVGTYVLRNTDIAICVSLLSALSVCDAAHLCSV